jgi:nucleotide-binding universal stress UspA family protein
LFRHVLIPLDGSAVSEQVVPHAVSMGALGTARYTLLHVLPPATLVGYPTATAGESLSWSECEERSARALLEREAAHLRLRSLAVKNVIWRHPHTAAAIREYAATHHADLIAMTTYGAALSRMVLGNVADRVTHNGPVPVLLYCPHNREMPAA